MHRLNKSHKGERGIALLMVLLMVTLLGSVVAEFQFNSRIDLQLATNARDELQAEYNALSAMRMRALLLKQSGKLKAGLDALQGLLGGDQGGAMPITQMLEMLPVECGIMSSIMHKLDADAIEDEDENKDETENFFQGECSATSVSEHSKISIGMLRHLSNRVKQPLKNMLLGLLSDKKMEEHFQSDDGSGSHAERPEDLVGAIVDWIDDNDSQDVSSVADEDRPYDFLRDPYNVKNAPFDSLAELQLVHGVDDALYALLRDNVTIYSDNTQMELATMPLERILTFGLPALAHKGVSLEQIYEHPGFVMLYYNLAEVKMLGGAGFGVINLKMLRSLLKQYGFDSVLDINRLSQVFTDKPNPTWFTITSQGRSGNVSRRIRAVYQAKEGFFYYVRME